MIMARRTLAFVLFVLIGGPTVRAQTARELYASALAREQAVRASMASDPLPPSTIEEVRAVVAAYRAEVKQFPASGYSDNALWQAGRLSLDGFFRFGQVRDRTTGIRLLRALATTYPTSKLVTQVPDQLARVQAALEADRERRPVLETGEQGARDTSERESASEVSGGGPPRVVKNGASASRASTAPRATITDIRRTVLSDAVRVTIELDAEVAFHEEHLNDPARVFVDFSMTRAAPPLVDRTLRFDADGDPVRQIRIGRHSHNVTRVVVDAIGISSYSTYPLYHPYRLVIDCMRAPQAAAVFLASRPLRTEWGRRLPSVSPKSTAAIADAVAEGAVAAPSIEEAPKIAVASAASAPPPAKNSNGGFSIARQLGLGVSKIVIDPGHGGRDHGAEGKGLTEAELVLDIALRLEKLLQRTPSIEVILTRRSDDFVPLQERTALANREGADLFLSIHANASATPRVRGIETYFLNFANSMSAAAVAARENAASGQAMGALPDIVKAIALNNKLAESRDFATDVQRAMIERLRGANKTVKDLGVKQAPFVVLIGAAMPSVLTETSFVTNPQESKLLGGSPYRQRIAEALYNAIRKYQTSLRKIQTVAHQ